MSAYEVMFRVLHDCPIGNISMKFPGTKIFQWCNGEHEVFELEVGDSDDHNEVVEEIRKVAAIVDSVSDDDKVHLVTRMCQCVCTNAVSCHIEKYSILQIDPVVYQEGWEQYRILSFRHEEIENLMKELKSRNMKIEIVRKAPFDGFIGASTSITANAIFSGMTEKQMDALVTAFCHGYYELPSRTNVQTIATKVDVPRSTYQEHLRKAEKKLVSALVPHIQMYRARSKKLTTSSC